MKGCFEKAGKAVHAAAAACMPSVPLLHLYNQNAEQNAIFFAHVLLIAAGLAAIGVLQFALLSRLVGPPPAVAVMAVFWAGFWLFGAARGLLPSVPGAVLLAALGLLVFAALLSLKLLGPRLGDFGAVFAALSCVAVAMFAANMLPALAGQARPAAGARRASYYEVEVAGERPVFHIKRTFHVEPGLPKPDIYWLHLDGMVSLATFGGFWGADMDWARDELAARGFVIYESARLRNSFSTRIAMPMLLSPAFYDSYWGILLRHVDEGFYHAAWPPMRDIIARDGVRLSEDVVMYFELYAALLHGGYGIRGVNAWWPVVHYARLTDAARGDGFLRGQWVRFLMSDLPQLLERAAPLPVGFFPDSEEAAPMPPGPPHFTWLYFNEAHSSLWHEFAPGYGGNAEMRLDLYAPAYEAVLAAMLRSVDEILAENPRAVIILQADHGLHRTDTHLQMEAMGLDKETSMELLFSVFSAARIPDEYGGLDEPLHPLNISRELVNRFVGENYALLEPSADADAQTARAGDIIFFSGVASRGGRSRPPLSHSPHEPVDAGVPCARPRPAHRTGNPVD